MTTKFNIQELAIAYVTSQKNDLSIPEFVEAIKAAEQEITQLMTKSKEERVGNLKKMIGK